VMSVKLFREFHDARASSVRDWTIVTVWTNFREQQGVFRRCISGRHHAQTSFPAS